MDLENIFAYKACTSLPAGFETRSRHIISFPPLSERRQLTEMCSFDSRYAPSQILLRRISIAMGTVVSKVVCALSA